MDFGQLCVYEQDNLRFKNQKAHVIFFGDSITQFWKVQDPSLFADESVHLNRGISGQTTSQMLVRFKNDVLDLNPDVVHIMAGTNDIAGNTGPITLERIQKNIRSIVEQAEAHHIKVIVGSVLPATRFDWSRTVLHPEVQIQALNAWLKAYAVQFKATYVDYHSAMTDGVGGLPSSLSGDGVHPNSAGYAVMKPLLLKALGESK